ncbi:hypothetical protein BP951000_2067 [Brachyspira pilosicoli 95/1000]|uniref:Uncharacterized protein n=1 Tax=Brachyspira pilosicoli (strain ATCC BAA-1826 / 95/1000) TaxID=759914 RepID=D8IFY1_BRAP9|nr:hypothetical protein BP951000_2067 [Brachyspira pilosicoli 95/1000]
MKLEILFKITDCFVFYKECIIKKELLYIMIYKSS